MKRFLQASLILIIFTILGSFTSFAAAETIKPEMVVRFTQGGIACLDQADLLEITMHALQGERTKADAMLVENGGGCLMLSSRQKYKVISAQYNNPDTPDLGIVEIVGVGKTALHGAWAYSIGAEEFQEPKRK